jgi:hypothetical protein
MIKILLLNSELEEIGQGIICHFLGIQLRGMNAMTKNFSQKSWSSDRDLNPDSREFN